MKKSILSKAVLMIFLILSIPFIASSALAATTASVPDPGTQCMDKWKQGESFVDFMDSGVMNTLTIIADTMYAISSIISSIDYFMTLTSSIIGMIAGGKTKGDLSYCCTPAVYNTGLCVNQFQIFDGWKDFMGNPLIKGFIDFTTCACCTGGEKDSNGNSVTTGEQAVAGGAVGICPLGFLSDKLLGGVKLGGNPIGNPSSGGIGRVGLSAYDNIYLAVGCLCPIAILVNLKKLKLIYQTHNCCVEEACKSGLSVETCERQFDEATCMYWEGSAIKMLITIIASIVTGFIAGLIKKWVEDNLLWRCLLMVLDLVRIPAKIQSLMSTFQNLIKEFHSPQCSDLGFGKIQSQLKSGMFSSSAGQSYILQDSQKNGIYTNVQAAPSAIYDNSQTTVQSSSSSTSGTNTPTTTPTTNPSSTTQPSNPTVNTPLPSPTTTGQPSPPSSTTTEQPSPSARVDITQNIYYLQQGLTGVPVRIVALQGNYVSYIEVDANGNLIQGRTVQVATRTEFEQLTGSTLPSATSS